MLGTNDKSLIIVDADALISFVYIADVNHNRAKGIMKQLAARQSTMLFPTTAICEAVTVMRGKLNRPDDAARIMQKFLSGDFPIQEVNQDIFFEAAKLYNPQASKKNTLFDAVIAAIAKKLIATAIFSFDEWYRKQGFTLAEDFLTEKKEAA